MINNNHPEDHQGPSPDDEYYQQEEDDFFQQLAEMEDEPDPDDEPERYQNEILSEIAQIVRPSYLTGLKTPAKGETWRNVHNRQVYTVQAIEQCDDPQKTLVIVLSSKTEISRVGIREFRSAWEKYTESDSASPPQAGETWQNIHTGYKVVINDVKQARQGLEVHATRDGKLTHTDIRTFVANHRRIKGSSQWFVGALKFGS